jgi:hypothetical protein
MLSNCLNNLISPFGSWRETLPEDMICPTGQFCLLELNS